MLQPGAVVGGDYRVERKLSEGGMGAVFVAEQISTGAKRALKIIKAELLDEPKLRARFEQEAKVAAKIESDHIVSVVAAGFVHRDLERENIFLADAKRSGVPFFVKVLDFGIARVVREAQASRTDSLGTPLWMSPEQAGTGETVGPAADPWSLALIVFSSNELSRAHLTGVGVPKDPAKALEPARAACDGGSSEGCATVGIMLAEGQGVAKDAGAATPYLAFGCRRAVTVESSSWA